MRWSYRIARIFGIDVRVHISFLLIVVYFAAMWGIGEPGGVSGALYGAVMVLLLFVLVTVHELSHSRVAQHYGIQVKSITLLPIGGLASMEEIPEDPRRELVISIAGPLSNVVMAAIMLLLAPVFFDTSTFFTTEALQQSLQEPSVQGAYLYLLSANILLALFNLLPAFPMDGGRVFRDVLALRMDRHRATRIAVAVGQVVALLLGLWGILGGGIFLLLIAVFIFFGAQAEGQGDDLRQVLGDLRVGHAVNTRVEYAHPSQSIGDLAARLFHIYQEDFPVLDDSGSVVGVVTRDRLIASLGQHGAAYSVALAMRGDFPTGRVSDTVYDAFVRMRGANLKAMPVVEDGRLVGMVSLEDISEVYALLSAGGPELVQQVTAERGAQRDGEPGGPVSCPPNT